MWVTFEPEYDEDAAAPAGIFPGTYVTHPFGFSGPGGASDPHDLAVVLLDSSPGIAPAQLPNLFRWRPPICEPELQVASGSVARTVTAALDR